MRGLYELHTHLYGCLQLEDLYWLAQRNLKNGASDLSVFTNSYKKVHAKLPNIKNLFDQQRNTSQQRLASYYYFTEHSNFSAFQCCFDLIISLSRTDAKEIEELCLRITQREEADYSEYRMMFSPLCSESEFAEKSLALCEAVAKAQKIRQTKQFRVIISLSRENNLCQRQYQVLRKLIREHSTVAKFLVGIDFCHIEEGHPPKHKKDLFAQVLEDNRKEPEHALAILYHVGESYNDKSVESAVRWIVEAANLGAHRLGHAIALGIPPNIYLNCQKKETIQERLDHIDFEIANAPSLKEAGYRVDINALSKERQRLSLEKSSTKKQKYLAHNYDPKKVEQLSFLQKWAMRQLKTQQTVIECCPTSNLRIANLCSPANHPLTRFLNNGLNVVIGSDDPGILRTSLSQEYQEIAKWPGIDQSSLTQLQENGRRFTSEKLCRSS